MALSRELKSRLESEEEPLIKRLKLARNVFSTVDLPILRKEDIIFDWLCKICLVEDEAWKYLLCCLQSENLNIKPSIKHALIDLLIHKLEKDFENLCQEVFECCSLLLLNARIQRYFNEELKNLKHLLKSLIRHILTCFKDVKVTNILVVENDLAAVIYNLAVTIVTSLMQIHKQSTDTKEEISTIFIHEVLCPLCSIIDQEHADNTNKLGATVYKSIQQLIFGKQKHIQNEMSATLSELFSTLAKNVKTNTLENNVATSMFIFHTAIGFYKTNNSALDRIFRELINVAGAYKKEILISILEFVQDIPFDFDNKIDDVTLSDFFQNIIDSVLSNTKLTCVDCKMLTRISYLNPILIEKRIELIISKIYLCEQTVACNNLLIGILNASILLRQQHKFVLQLLTALKDSRKFMEGCDTNIFTSYPFEFKENFTKSVGSFTNSHVLTILNTLTEFLNTDCMELLKTNRSCKNIIMMKATVELLIAFLEGVSIFECTGTLLPQQEFVNSLTKLGNVLSSLVEKTLNLRYKEDIIVTILSAIQAWSEIHVLLRYYVPMVFTSELTFPIAEDHWQQLIQRIIDFGETESVNSLNKLLLHQLKHYGTINNPMKLDTLIGGLEQCWSNIIEYNTEIIAFLSDEKISHLTSMLLTDMVSSEKCFLQWIEIISKDSLQENRRFLICFLYHVFIQIGSTLTDGISKSIIELFNKKLLIKAEVRGKSKVKKTIEAMREMLLKCDWKQIETIECDKIKPYLSIISHMPITFFKPDVKTLIFIITYAISKECKAGKDIVEVCRNIFLKIFQTSGVDILQYVDLVSITHEVSECKAFPKALEQSLRNVTSYDVLKTLIDSSKHSKELIYIILECIENVKPKLQVTQRLIFKKAERKLSQKLADTLPTVINDPFNVKCLTLVLKVARLNQDIDNTLKEAGKSTLNEIFKFTDDSLSQIANELIQETLQMATIIFRASKEFEIPDSIVKKLWFVMLRFPCQDLLLPLISSTGPNVLYDLFNMLRLEMVKQFSNLNENHLENIFTIWNAILKSDMSAKRNKFRISAIENLFKDVQLLKVPEKSWPKLLELFHSILISKHLYTSNSIIDLIISLSLRSLENPGGTWFCDNVLTLCESMIKIKTGAIVDRLPILLLLYRRIVSITVRSSKMIKDKFEEHRFRCLALHIEKVTNSLVKLKKDVTRICPYIIADLISLLSEGGLLPFLKISLENIVSLLISICDQYGIALLFRALPAPMQQIFKIQLEAYNKYHKYFGKI